MRISLPKFLNAFSDQMTLKVYKFEKKLLFERKIEGQQLTSFSVKIVTQFQKTNDIIKWNIRVTHT